MLKNTFIKLSNSKQVIVDEDDFEYLNQWKWNYSGKYASRFKNNKRIYMHRVINNTPDGLFTDHINRNKLDNRKCNLRTCDKSLNGLNRTIIPHNKSGVSGVCWSKQANKWKAYIGGGMYRKHLGYFKYKKDAIESRRLSC